MDCLQRLRSAVGLPLPVSSAYRSPDHPVEASKEVAMDAGFTGIGVKQSGEGRFIHLDTITHLDDFPAERPTIWSY